MLGHFASSQTVFSPRLTAFFLIDIKRSPPGRVTLSHGGFFLLKLVVEGTIFLAMIIKEN